MGRQSSRLWFGTDHKDIYYNGYYHKQMYLTDKKSKTELVWEKLEETEIPVFSFKVQDTTVSGRTGEVVGKGVAYIYFEKIEGQEVIIDWGDGTQTILPSYETTSNTEWLHAYPTNNGTIYNVTLSGGFGGFMGCCANRGHLFNGYSCISELNSPILPQMLGSNVSGGNMFGYLITLKKISGNLFEKIRDVNYYYSGMFSNSGLTEIPTGLFAGISQANIGNMFYNCNDLTTINANSFLGVDAIGANNPFATCSNLRFMYDAPANVNWASEPLPGSIEIADLSFVNAVSLANIFSNNRTLKKISPDIFKLSPNVKNLSGCFGGCVNLSEGIREDMFDYLDEISDVSNLFYYCSSITANVPRLWERAEANKINHYACYYGCTNAANYNDIPEDWKVR